MTEMHSVRSRFRLWALLPLVVMLPFVIGFLLFLPLGLTGETSVVVVIIALFLFLVFIFAWLVFGEIRTKAIVVTIDGNCITVRSYLGLGGEKTYLFSEFDGFVTCEVPNRYETFEYLYLMQGNKKVVKLSAYYHKNYQDLKGAIAAVTTDLGVIPYRLAEDIHEIFA